MKLTHLLKEFNVVIDTAEGLDELRSLILGQAVRGKLVPQYPNDKPASELLKKIEAEKQRLYDEGEIRKPKDLPPVKEDEIPFEIPDNWEWTRLGDSSFNLDAKRIPLSRADRENRQGDYPYYGASGIIDHIDDYIFEDDLLLIGEDGANLINRSTPIAFIATGKYWVNNHAHVLDAIDFKLLKWLEAYVNSINLEPYVTGTAQPKLNQTRLNKILIALPPFAEQHRIVQKIESLFAEVDELEVKLNRQTKLDEKLQMAVNTEVQQAPDAEASKSAWSFITSNFDTLYHTPEAIDNLKKNILNEAVRGRLVPQNPNDEPASELLKKIEAEKQRLYKEGEIRKPKNLPPVKKDEIPFEIPESWEWSRLEVIGLTQTGTTPKTSQTEYYGNFIPFVGPGDMSDDSINYSNNGLSKKGFEVGRLIPEGSILMVCIGGSIGKCYLVDRDVSCNQQINTITPIVGVNGDYIKSLFKSDYFQKSILSKSTGSATPIINRTKWGNIPFSLPPLEEQHRIVQRIEELFAICDRFKAQLEKRKGVNERLVKGLVGEVLGGS